MIITLLSLHTILRSLQACRASFINLLHHCFLLFCASFKLDTSASLATHHLHHPFIDFVVYVLLAELHSYSSFSMLSLFIRTFSHYKVIISLIIAAFAIDFEPAMFQPITKCLGLYEFFLLSTYKPI